MPDHHPAHVGATGGQDPLLVQAAPGRRVRMGAHRRAGARMHVGDRHRQPFHIRCHALLVGHDLQHGRAEPGVTDPGGHVPLEQRLQRPVLVIEDLAPAAVMEREREVVVGVVAGGEHDLQAGALGRPGDKRRVAVQARHGHVDNRANPGLAEPAEPLARGRHLGLGIPAPEAGPALLQGLCPDEHVLVHEHRAEIVDVDLPGGGRNVGHGVLPPVRDEGCHGGRNAPH